MSIAKSAGVWAVVAVLAGVGTGVTAERAPPAAEPPEIAIEAFAGARADPGLLVIDLRDDEAIAAAMIGGAIRPAQIDREKTGRDCVAVLVADPTTAAEAVTAMAARLRAAGCAVHRLAGNAAAWRAAGLLSPQWSRRYRRPGEVPFVVPRGLCERGEPVQLFE